MEIKGKTLDNLILAINGEALARTKYEFFTKTAKAEGYDEIANILDAIGKNELAHTEIWYKFINGTRTTIENLMEGIEDEHYKWSEMYVEFSKTAYDEGYDEIGRLFTGIAKIEKKHEEMLKGMLKDLQVNDYFSKGSSYECLNCGHHHVGQKAPTNCPICGYAKCNFKKQE